jgi:uncharacterized protein
MMTPIQIFFGLLLTSLLLVSLRILSAILSDTAQKQRSTQRDAAERHIAQTELSSRLKQTYIDLSLVRRQATWREVTVAKVVQESEDVRSYYLVDPAFEPLPTSLPGQHILVDPNNAFGCRCYTLSDDCTAGHWRISVKKHSSSRTSTSCWLHDEVSAGDTLKVRGPLGSFFLQPTDQRNVIFVSAGIGITPMLPMLLETMRRPHRSVQFFAQFRDVGHMPFAESLSSIASNYPQVQVRIWISRFPNGVRRASGGLFSHGKFQASDLVAHQDPFLASDYYLCGPEEWQGKMRSDLMLAGVPSESIRYELFQPSEKPTSKPVQIAEHQVHFKQTGASATFESSHRSLLAFAGQNSVELESGCRTGACGSCAVKLLRGKVRYTREPQFQTQNSEILPCVCVPESDLEVDA